MTTDGFFGMGIYDPKTEDNVGTLWRGAYQLGANHIFTIGNRTKLQHSDVFKTWRKIPLFEYADLDQLLDVLFDCAVVAVESGGVPLPEFLHPKRCVYLLGSEDNGLPPAVLRRCHFTVTIPAIRNDTYNVAQAGTLVMYDRFMKLSPS